MATKRNRDARAGVAVIVLCGGLLLGGWRSACAEEGTASGSSSQEASSTPAADAAGGETGKPKLSKFKDPEDGAIDLSRWLAGRTGILPIAMPITEPAVGFGAAAALIRFHGGGMGGGPKPVGPTGRPISPDVAVLAGGLTENGTWAAVVGYLGHFKNDTWRYKGALGRISPNLDYYGSNDRAYQFNLDGWVVYQELGHGIGKTDLFAGLQFTYLDTTVKFDLSELPEEIPRRESTTTESGLGVVLEYDTRDNSFTPNSGVALRANAAFLGSYLGGDHDFQRYTAAGRFWWDPIPRVVLKARGQIQTVQGDVPFYALPFVFLRGIPAMRYQGDSAVSLDGEVRWNLWKRWSLVAFAGAGWTDAASGFKKQGESVHAGGLGFRYLIARAMGLQMGLDFAKGPEQSAVYVVVGSSF